MVSISYVNKMPQVVLTGKRHVKKYLSCDMQSFGGSKGTINQSLFFEEVSNTSSSYVGELRQVKI